jgi:predicted transcriptional regulator of viral defense system
VADATATKPDWTHLYEIAAAQDGYFTTLQAASAGYSPQLLLKHTRSGRFARMRRGIYRLVHFPPTDHEELAVIWLWSDRAGVFSHQTALSLHDLSDVLPSHVHLTLPAEWQRRRFRVPDGVVLHHAEVPPEDRVWFGSVPITSPRRTLSDCARDRASPEQLRRAAQQALKRGLIARSDLADVEQALAPFGGLTG